MELRLQLLSLFHYAIPQLGTVWLVSKGLETHLVEFHSLPGAKPTKPKGVLCRSSASSFHHVSKRDDQRGGQTTVPTPIP